MSICMISDTKESTVSYPPGDTFREWKGSRRGEQETSHFSSVCFCTIHSELALHYNFKRLSKV